VSDGTPVDIYEPVIADLRQRIASLQAMLDNLEALRGGTTLKIAATRPAGASPPTSFRNDSFFGLSAGEAAKKYLSAIKKTAPLTEIRDALLAGGWKTAAKNILENLRAIISRNEEFVRINGEWGLAEWYPGRKSGKRSTVHTSSAAVEEDEDVDYDLMRDAAEESSRLSEAEDQRA
jgi:hypothetical protein